MLAKGSFNDLMIKGVPVKELYEMDKQFEGLKDLGIPEKIDSIYMTAEPKWIYHYPGFRLTFVQFFPTGPELLEIEVTDAKAGFSTSGRNLFENNRQTLKSNLNQLKFQEVSPKLSDNEKFGKELRYLEFQYSANKINKIIYKIDPNL